MTDATDAATLFARKKKARSGHRGYTTRLLNQATAIMGADDLDTEELSLVKDMLVEKIGTLKALDGEMADLVPEEELEDEIERADEHMMGVYRILANRACRHSTPCDCGKNCTSTADFDCRSNPSWITGPEASGTNLWSKSSSRTSPRRF